MAKTHGVKSSKRNILGPVLLMVVPAVCVVLSVILFALSNLIFGVGSDFQTTNPVQSVLGVLFFILGTGGVIAFLPCMIAGIVWLVVSRKDASATVVASPKQ